MKKQTRSRKAQSKQVRTVKQAALADVSAGTGTEATTLVEPYVPQQHNETILGDRQQVARRGGGGARRGSQVTR